MKQLLPKKTEIQLAVSVGICVLLAEFISALQMFALCAGVLMCGSDTAGASLRSSLVRLQGVVICGFVGVAAVLVDNQFHSWYGWILLAAAGTLLSLMLCRLSRMPPMACRVGCITFILVIGAAAGEARLLYAVYRVLSTVLGGALAVGVSAVFGLRNRKKRAGDEPAQ